MKSNTIFSNMPTTPTVNTEKNVEKRKLSYWLEKLHIQREQTRIDNNRREKKSNSNTNISTSQNEIFEEDQANTEMGINEFAKNTATKNEADKEMVNDLVKKSNRRIISISSVFPIDLFPNTIYVEESRVTFKFRQFLATQSHSVDIKDISNVLMESSLFFATLQVVSRTYTQNDIRIGNLNKKKAKKVQKIIEGLRTLAEHDINTSHYEIDELISKIGEFHSNHATQ